MSGVYATNEIERFLAGFSGSARGKWNQEVESRRSKGWTDTEIMLWLCKASGKNNDFRNLANETPDDNAGHLILERQSIHGGKHPASKAKVSSNSKASSIPDDPIQDDSNVLDFLKRFIEKSISETPKERGSTEPSIGAEPSHGRKETHPEKQLNLKENRAKHSTKLESAFWTLALGSGLWLVHSMAEALGGGWWNHLIAAAFEITPILLFGAKVQGRRSEALITRGGFLIFGAGLFLFLAPHLQTLKNELSMQIEARADHSRETAVFESRKANLDALAQAAKSTFDDAQASYEKKLQLHGGSNWRTVLAAQKREKELAEWKRLTDEFNSLSRPTVPQITNGLRGSLQEIIKRLGLFLVAFFSMYAVRNLGSRPLLGDDFVTKIAST